MYAYAIGDGVSSKNDYGKNKYYQNGNPVKKYVPAGKVSAIIRWKENTLKTSKDN